MTTSIILKLAVTWRAKCNGENVFGKFWFLL